MQKTCVAGYENSTSPRMHYSHKETSASSVFGCSSSAGKGNQSDF